MTLVPYQSIVHIISWYLIGCVLWRVVVVVPACFSLASGTRSAISVARRPLGSRAHGVSHGLGCSPLRTPRSPISPPLVPQLLASQPMVTRCEPSVCTPRAKDIGPRAIHHNVLAGTQANVHGPTPPHFGHPRPFHTGFRKIAKPDFKYKFSIRMSGLGNITKHDNH